MRTSLLVVALATPALAQDVAPVASRNEVRHAQGRVVGAFSTAVAHHRHSRHEQHFEYGGAEPHEGPDGTVAFVTSEGVLLLETRLGTLRLVPEDERRRWERVRAACFDGRGRLWCVAREGVGYLEGPPSCGEW